MKVSKENQDPKVSGKIIVSNGLVLIFKMEYHVCLRDQHSRAEMNVSKEIGNIVPNPLLSTINRILGLTRLCQVSSPGALQAHEVYMSQIWQKFTSFVIQFIT